MRTVVCVTQGLPPKTIDARAAAVQRGRRREYPDRSLLVPLGRHDEAALEVALRLREAHGGTIVAVSYGAPDGGAVDSLRAALALGVDDALLVGDPAAERRDSSATAAVLAQAARRYGPPDLVILGRRGSAWEMGITPQLLASRLGAPFVDGIDIRRTDGATSEAVVVAAIARSGTVRPRVPSFGMIERAFAADIERVAIAGLDLDEGWDSSRSEIVEVAERSTADGASDASQRLVNGADELADHIVANLSLVNR